MLAAAAADLATIDASLSAAHTAATAPTVALVPAATDEVSVNIAHLFSQHGKDYQALAAQAGAFHQQFIQNLNASARSYASTEAASTSSLRSLDASTGSHASANAGAQKPVAPSIQLPVTIRWGDVTLLLLGGVTLFLLFLPVALPLLGLLMLANLLYNGLL
jgi:PE family